LGLWVHGNISEDKFEDFISKLGYITRFKPKKKLYERKWFGNILFLEI
jgi:hypothetical protein